LLYVQTFVSGILSAGVLTLMVVGFSLQWRSLKIVNLAHFSLVLLSAYVTYDFSTRTGYTPFLAAIIVVPLFAALAVGFQWVFDRFEVTVFNSLLLTFGFFILIEGVIRNVWGADFLRIDSKVNPYAVKSVVLFDIAVPVAPLIAFTIAVPVVLAGSYYLRRSYFGKGLRAVAQDREIAVAYGVNYRRTAMVLTAASGATAAMAGLLFAVVGSLFPSASQEWIGLGFAVVILGGIGSPVGVLIAAMLIGGITGVGSAVWGPSAAQLIMFVVLIGVLLWRPEGLFRRLQR
jgi:Branched-chain amino acid ABC-type transport system, permease components